MNEEKATEMTNKFIAELESRFGPERCTLMEFVGVLSTVVDELNTRLQLAREEAERA